MKVFLCFFLFTIFTQVWCSCPGSCQPNSYPCPGNYLSGYCPGGNDIQCCEESTPSCPGQCQVNTLTCYGNYTSGLCPGASDIQCCQVVPEQYSGVDVSDLVSVSNFNCLNSDGYDFAIVRCYHSYGAPDTNAPATISNAHSANFSRVDVYMFPCPTCGDPEGQVAEAVTALSSNNAQYTGFWLDIEGGSDYWYSDVKTNQEFFEGLVNAAESYGLRTGVYTSASQWNPIMGPSYTSGSKFPLWYAHYDSTPSFSDFQPFGGWTTPSLKQYNGDITICNVGLDVNWAPTLNY